MNKNEQYRDEKIKKIILKKKKKKKVTSIIKKVFIQRLVASSMANTIFTIMMC